MTILVFFVLECDQRALGKRKAQMQKKLKEPSTVGKFKPCACFSLNKSFALIGMSFREHPFLCEMSNVLCKYTRLRQLKQSIVSCEQKKSVKGQYLCVGRMHFLEK